MPAHHTFLKTTDLLRGMSDEMLAGILPQLREVSVAAGAPLFAEGEGGESVYLVADGTLRIEKDGVPLATRGPGECIGEFALIDSGLRSASAIALTDATLLEWPRADAWDALSASPDLRRSIFAVLVGKLRQDASAQVAAAVARERVQQDMRRAGEIQKAMLPASDLETDDILISGISRPAQDVGGDYFDHAVLGDRRFSIFVGDVSGHGLYAALLVAMAKACFQTQIQIDPRTSAVVQAMNRSLWLSVRSDMLMTCVSVTIDAAAGVLSYTNAGHPSALRFDRQRGDVEVLDSTDPLLGLEIFRHAVFNEARTTWHRGDILLIYSDGVTEAASAAGDEFGLDRLTALLRESHQLPADRIRARVFDEIASFTGARPQEDDATVVVVQAR